MCFISRWRVVCLFVVASLLYVGCLVPSNPEESCNNGINRASIDPTGFACKEDCECNNQQFIAKCQEGADGQKKCVVLTTREPCSTKGRKEYCFLEKDQLPPNLKCFWGVRTCQDTGLQILNWGDCRPPNTKDIDEKKALETKLAALNNDPNQLSKEDQEKFRDYCTDGIDNDCDGQADYHSEVLCQGFCKPGEIRLCYGEDATQQVPSFGICRRGQQVCTEKYTWGPCQNFVAPTKEVCDKQDNDCNGKIDDVAGCTPPPACKKGEIRSCFTAQQGCTRDGLGFACKGNCQAGISRCDDKGNWGECTNQIGPQQEQCDHQDNDCDGTVDEGCTCQPNTTQYCFPSALRFRNKGICRDGLQQCVKGVWGDCVGSTTPQTEVCDFQDNNCDGAVDDGCNCTTGQERTCYAGAAAKRNIGECRDGNQICQRGVWGACTQSVLPTLEECDGKDNDCDGQVDENLIAPLCDNQKGVCKGARKSCGGAAGWTACDDTSFAAHDPAYVAGNKEDKSHCDGKDNDCDGQIDETCPAAACQAGATRPCYTGDPSTKGVGECKDGLQFCFQNQWSQRCYSEITPSVERCGDNKDNDCNGLIDETCEATKEAIADAGPEMPVELPPEAQCVPGTKRTCPYYAGGKIYAGIGICSVGTQTCAANAKWEATCTGQVLPQAGEDCNGKDDNCNGIIDEPFLLTAPTTQCSKTKGACQGIKPRCVNGAWETTCDYAAYTTLYQAQETLCDGIDNDCNGTIDESCPWAQLFGGKLYAATVDTKGTIYVVGYFDDSTNIPNCTSRYFGTSTIPKASTFQFFIASVKPSGQAQLLQTFTTGLPNQENNAVRIHKIRIDSTGNIYLAGDFKKELKLGSYTLRTGEYPKGDNWNGFLAKLDTKGVVQWASPIQSQTGTHTYDLVLHTDTQGKTFITVVGVASGITVIFQKPPTTLTPTITPKDFTSQSYNNLGSLPQDEAYIARFDTTGTLQWAKSVAGSDSSTQFRAAAVDIAGNVYVAGNTYSNLSWKGKVHSANSGELYWHFIAQFTSSGQYGWFLQGGRGDQGNLLPDQGRSHLVLQTKAKGEVEIYYASFSPSFKGTFGSLTLPLSYGRERMFVTQITQPASGSTTCGSQPVCWNWIKVIDTPGIDKPSGLAIDTKGDLYLSGVLSAGTVANAAVLVSFGSIQRRASTGDSFVARLASSGTFQDVATAGGITAMKPTGVAFLPGSQKIYALGNLDQVGQQPLVSFHNRSAQAPLCQRWSYLWELNVAKLTP